MVPTPPFDFILRYVRVRGLTSVSDFHSWHGLCGPSEALEEMHFKFRKYVSVAPETVRRIQGLSVLVPEWV